MRRIWKNREARAAQSRSAVPLGESAREVGVPSKEIPFELFNFFYISERFNHSIQLLLRIRTRASRLVTTRSWHRGSWLPTLYYPIISSSGGAWAAECCFIAAQMGLVPKEVCKRCMQRFVSTADETVGAPSSPRNTMSLSARSSLSASTASTASTSL